MLRLLPLLLLLLTAGAFTSCLEEQNDVLIEAPTVTEQPTEVEDLAEDQHYFTLDNQNYGMTGLYVQTTPLAEGGYEHHLLLTTGEEEFDGDLSGLVKAAAAIIYRTAEASPIGVHSTEASSPISHVEAAHMRTDFYLNQYGGMSQEFTPKTGEINLKLVSDAEYEVEVAFRGPYASQSFSGKYRGPLTQVEAAGEDQPITDSDFPEMPNQFVQGNKVVELSGAFAQGEVNADGEFTHFGLMFLTVEDVIPGPGGSGTTDLLMAYPEGFSTAKRYEGTLTPEDDLSLGYFAASRKQVNFVPNWCINMNFADGSVDDDIPVDDTKAVMRYRDGILEIRGSGYLLGTGEKVEYAYTGPVTPMD